LLKIPSLVGSSLSLPFRDTTLEHRASNDGPALWHSETDILGQK
jgi:hypothetical protein